VSPGRRRPWGSRRPGGQALACGDATPPQRRAPAGAGRHQVAGGRGAETSEKSKLCLFATVAIRSRVALAGCLGARSCVLGQIWRGGVAVLDTCAASVRRALPRGTRPARAGRRSRCSTSWGIDTNQHGDIPSRPSIMPGLAAATVPKPTVRPARSDEEQLSREEALLGKSRVRSRTFSRGYSGCRPSLETLFSGKL
jgi:hypothetical protein